MLEIKKILFACDVREDVSNVVPYVLSMSEKYQSTVYIVHVVQDIQRWGTGYLPHRTMEDLQEEALQEAQKAMDKICEQHFAGRSDIKKVVVSGDPASQILKMIDNEGIEMVIMGTHGHGPLQQVVCGSVAENVVYKSPVPVLTVNPSRPK